jgi:hypothetical protein
MAVAPAPPVGLPATGYPPGPPRPRGKPRRWGLLFLAVLGVAALVLGAIYAAAISTPAPMGPATTASYRLSYANASFAFPSCAVVSVTWQDMDHHQVGFGVASGEAYILSACRGPANSGNSSCLPGWCQPNESSTGGGPIEYQIASHGSFQFTATQPAYGFFADQGNSTAPTTDPIQFNVSYTTPIIPASWAVPALLGLFGLGGVALVVAIVIAVRRVRRSE